MICEICKDLKEISNEDAPYTIKKCKGCGRELKIRDPGEHGIGIKVKEGDKFVIPGSWLKIHVDPLRGTSYFTKQGLEWFAKLIFLDDLPRKYEEIEETISKNESHFINILNQSKLLEGFDLNDSDQHEDIFNIVNENKGSIEWFAYIFGTFNEIAKDAITEGDPLKSAWAMACAERFRSMLVFKEDLEDVVWMGHSAKRLVNILNEWDGNKENSDEEFWQIKFSQNSYVLSQAFSVPVVFIQDKAYIGGMGIDRKNAKFVDFLFSSPSGNQVVLIEIKTPMTKLLGRKYRNIFRPSTELSGALIQANDYRSSLLQNLSSLSQDLGKKLSAFNPRCLIIAGNIENELNTELKRRSFELFRSSLQNIDIVTYDELFKKIEVMATLFNLIKK